MTYKFVKSLNICGLRYPKVVEYNNDLLLFSGTLLNEFNEIKKYGTTMYSINKHDFSINKTTKKILNFDSIIKDSYSDLYISYWLRDVYLNPESNSLNMLIEFKFNNNNKNYTHKTILLNTNDFLTYKIIKEYNYEKFFIFKEINDIILSSEIISDGNFFWGSYLFKFIKNNKTTYNPNFDNIVKYNNDSGHVLHNVKYYEILNEYEILFSIRHKISNENDYIYKLYTSKTTDFINFTETKELEIENFDNKPEWFSYPSLFNYNNKEYMICNQDEFGKSKEPLIFKK